MRVNDCPAVRTAVPVDDAPAGPAMDAAVARALGLCPHELVKTIHRWEDGCGEVSYECKLCHAKFWGLAYKEGLLAAPYSTDIAAAWVLVTKELSGFELTWDDYEGAVWFCYTGEIARADTAPLAICRAFLKARGVGEVGT